MNKIIIISLILLTLNKPINSSAHNKQNAFYQESIENVYGHILEKKTYADGYTLENKTTHKKIVVCTNKHLLLHGVQAGINTQNNHKEIQYSNGDLLLENDKIVTLIQWDPFEPDCITLQTACKKTSQDFAEVNLPRKSIHRTNLDQWIFEHN